MHIFIAVLIGMMLFFSTDTAFSYEELYPPYKFKDGAPAHLKAKGLIKHKRSEFKSKDGNVRINFYQSDDWSFSLRIEDNGQILLDRVAQEPPFPNDVYWADLDGNGQKDFIVISWNGGAGLGGHECRLEIFLKEKEGLYHKISYDGMSPGLEDFVDLDNDRKYEVIITGVYDGQRHNYFTYNIYEFRDFKLINVDAKFSGFPKFIWMTYKNNDKDTNHLMKEERRIHSEEKNKRITYDVVGSL